MIIGNTVKIPTVHSCVASKMKIDLYYHPISMPSRIVLLTAKILDIELNLIEIDLMGQEQLKPYFVKLNPQHTVPTIDDNGFYLWESRAIVTYLVNKYSRDDSLYSKEPKRRAIIDQRLYFDGIKLYPAFIECYRPVMMGKTVVDSEKLKNLQDAMEIFDSFLDQTTYAADNQLTIADVSLVVTVSGADAVGFDISPYRNIATWLWKMKKEIPGYEEIVEGGLQHMKQTLKFTARK